MQTQFLACVCVCSRVGLIKTQNTFARKKNRKTKAHFGFRNFQDVLYIYNYIYISLSCNRQPQKSPSRDFRTSVTPRVQSLKKLSSIENCLTVGNGQRSRSFISFVLVARGMSLSQTL